MHTIVFVDELREEEKFGFILAASGCAALSGERSVTLRVRPAVLTSTFSQHNVTCARRDR